MFVALDDHDPRPIYQQIVAQIKDQVRAGTLRPGDELPSVRELADSLGINLHTAHAAYQRLRDQGVIVLRLGRRARVARPGRSGVDREAAEAQLAPRIGELITDAYHLGLSPRELRGLFNIVMKAKGPGGRSR